MSNINLYYVSWQKAILLQTGRLERTVRPMHRRLFPIFQLLRNYD
jgi:hypothetical protein